MSIRQRFGRYLEGYEPEDDESLSSEPVSAYIRQTMLEGIRELDPAASLQGFASIRLTGDRYRDGLFDILAADIFTQIDREIRAAAPTEVADQLMIGFRDVRAGSVVLPLAAFEAEPPSGATLDVPRPSPLEVALVRVLNLHDLIERDDIPDDWSAEAVPKELAHRFRILVESLDKADANIEIDLSQHNGRRRTSRLTGRGRARANRLFEPRAYVETAVKDGYLAGINVGDEFAQVDLRPSSMNKRKTTIVQVPTETAKRLPWDVYLRIEVRVVTTSDRFGDRKKVEYQYIRVVDHADPLPGTNAPTDSDEGWTSS